MIDFTYDYLDFHDGLIPFDLDTMFLSCSEATIPFKSSYPVVTGPWEALCYIWMGLDPRRLFG